MLLRATGPGAAAGWQQGSPSLPAPVAPFFGALRNCKLFDSPPRPPHNRLHCTHFYSDVHLVRQLAAVCPWLQPLQPGTSAPPAATISLTMSFVHGAVVETSKQDVSNIVWLCCSSVSRHLACRCWRVAVGANHKPEPAVNTLRSDHGA